MLAVGDEPALAGAAHVVDHIDRHVGPFLQHFNGRTPGRHIGLQCDFQRHDTRGLAGLAFADPGRSLAWSIAFASFIAFASATQDVVVDAWRIDAAPAERQGMMSATYQLGYCLSLLCAGAGALYIADFVSWKAAYLAMAAIAVAGAVISLQLSATSRVLAISSGG